ncbi:hypothetical protein AVDCRST_MAG94-1317 [uncultured Leptolyngbya sp.]|uniref:Uncharacterized protein n=1 Tax=uncultured Leptolyngbya sp. TaxID=332963 RepID=A0A6J4KYK2_9CYAN|nr:hypothetical protein AVDCRST_MAG94-1317 [uncultured Leptolyngbya sp.]
MAPSRGICRRFINLLTNWCYFKLVSLVAKSILDALNNIL